MIEQRCEAVTIGWWSFSFLEEAVSTPVFASVATEMKVEFREPRQRRTDRVNCTSLGTFARP